MGRKEKKSPFSSLTSLGIYRRVFLIFFIICILITIFSFQYYGRLASTIREESEAYLQEISRRIGANVDRIVNDNYDVLHTMAASLEHSEIHKLEEAKKMLQMQKEGLGFESIFLIDQNGIAYDLSDLQTFLTLDKLVRKDLLSGKDSMSTTQLIQNKEYILFSVPLDDMNIDDKTMVALAASYAPSSFDQVLSMSSFNDQAYSQIVTMNGAVVVRSSSSYAFKSGYNIFSTLEGLIIGGTKLSDVMEEMAVNASGQIRFNLDGRETYMVYTPVAPDNWYLLSFVPVEVVNEKSNLLLNSTLVICGMIAVTFAGLAAALVYIFNNHKRKLEQIAYVDEVTGGHTIQRFYELAEELLTANHNLRYALVYTNIVKFKVLNDELGRINCDSMLRFFSEYMNKKISESECIGRQSADHFCILIQFSDEYELLDKFRIWHEQAEQTVIDMKVAWSLPIMEFGIYVIDNNTLTFPQMIDRAKLALRESPRAIDSKLRCAFYNDEVRRKLLREKQLEDRMEAALKNGEFVVFLQPKYHLPEERIGGAEALVRWKSTSEGMIFPDEFIPLFEKKRLYYPTGFICI